MFQSKSERLMLQIEVHCFRNSMALDCDTDHNRVKQSQLSAIDCELHVRSFRRLGWANS